MKYFKIIPYLLPFGLWQLLRRQDIHPIQGISFTWVLESQVCSPARSGLQCVSLRTLQ